MNITTIGLDLAKNVFQVHGVDVQGNTVLRKRLRRKDVLPFFATLGPCVVGVEACGTAHHWAREIRSVGHEVKLISPAYVKPYVKRNKNDSADAEAICEAVGRPSMRFVPVKSTDQQSVLILHRARDLLVRQRTMLVNALRGHLAEYGIVTAQGIGNVRRLFEMLEDGTEASIPALARRVLSSITEQLRQSYLRIRELELEIMAWHKSNEQSQRLATIPGIGPITATAIVASVGDSSQFRSGRHFAAWLGLVPRQNSSGDKERLGRISKRGDKYIRRLLVIGATSVIRYARSKASPRNDWLNQLLARRPARLVSVALANKMARIAWALLTRGEVYRVPATPLTV
jgi:transposase